MDAALKEEMNEDEVSVAAQHWVWDVGTLFFTLKHVVQETMKLGKISHFNLLTDGGKTDCSHEGAENGFSGSSSSNSHNN